MAVPGSLPSTGVSSAPPIMLEDDTNGVAQHRVAHPVASQRTVAHQDACAVWGGAVIPKERIVPFSTADLDRGSRTWLIWIPKVSISGMFRAFRQGFQPTHCDPQWLEDSVVCNTESREGRLIFSDADLLDGDFPLADLVVAHLTLLRCKKEGLPPGERFMGVIPGKNGGVRQVQIMENGRLAILSDPKASRGGLC